MMEIKPGPEVTKKVALPSQSIATGGGSAARSAFDGFLASDEVVVSSLSNALVLTSRKLIQYDRDPMNLSVSLPLETINYISVGRSRRLAMAMIFIASFMLLGCFVGVANGKAGPETVVTLIVGGLLLALGIFLLRRKIMLFSSAGGTASFAYVLGSFFGSSTTGIQLTTYCHDDEMRTFLREFFDARERQRC